MLTENFTVPQLPEITEADLTAMRDNWFFLLISAARQAQVVPGWDTTITSNSSPVDYTKPDIITLTRLDTAVSPNVTKTLRYEYTYTGNNLTTIVFKFGDGVSSPELETVTGGTITLTYDGSGNFTGATSA